MLGKTHRMAGLAFMMVGFEVMRHNDLLLPDVNPLLQLAVMYPASQYGSVFADNDHHWRSVGHKTPVNWVAHKLLHLTRPKHRSWQTHSILVTGSTLSLLYVLVLLGNQVWSSPSDLDWVIMRLILTGFIVGYTSHLFSDFLNPSGIHLYPGFKIRGVPKNSFFATGGKWETYYGIACLVISAVVAINIILTLLGIDLINYLISEVPKMIENKV